MGIRRICPRMISAPLWGDRKRWGLTINYDDPCWREWQKTYSSFYASNQREGVGVTVNDAGYRVMSSVNLANKNVLEIGAGDIRHMVHWHGKPAEYILADVHEEMMKKAQLKLTQADVHYRSILVQRGELLPIESGSVDVVISFYSLEHLYPLRPYLEEMNRVLKPGGVLIGAIPAEGGLAWGIGRLITSRRWFKKNTNIDPDKIICWEHPNFADDILDELNSVFCKKKAVYWPMAWTSMLDVNLIISFNYCKNSH